MVAMTKWNLSVRATLDRAMNDQDGLALGLQIGRDAGQTVFASVSSQLFGLSTVVEDQGGDGLAALGEFRDLVAEQLAQAGYVVVAWEALEVRTPAETERRIETASVPPLVNTEQFAGLLGVSRQRVSELESERRAGKRGDFPSPMVPGWWIRAAAERYAQTRQSTPGRPAKGS